MGIKGEAHQSHQYFKKALGRIIGKKGGFGSNPINYIHILMFLFVL